MARELARSRVTFLVGLAARNKAALLKPIEDGRHRRRARRREFDRVVFRAGSPGGERL
jgi:hypothetical protein